MSENYRLAIIGYSVFSYPKELHKTLSELTLVMDPLSIEIAFVGIRFNWFSDAIAWCNELDIKYHHFSDEQKLIDVGFDLLVTFTDIHHKLEIPCDLEMYCLNNDIPIQAVVVDPAEIEKREIEEARIKEEFKKRMDLQEVNLYHTPTPTCETTTDVPPEILRDILANHAPEFVPPPDSNPTANTPSDTEKLMTQYAMSFFDYVAKQGGYQ
jgi:hypothetical protein